MLYLKQKVELLAVLIYSLILFILMMESLAKQKYIFDIYLKAYWNYR